MTTLGARKTLDDPVRLGVLLAPAHAVKHDARGSVLFGMLRTHDGDVRAYVKVPSGPPRRLYVEIACALIGRAAGLAVPEPLLALIFPAQAPFLNLAEPVFGFGSVQVSSPGLPAQHLDGPIDAIRRALSNTSDFHLVCAFDEWIANNDRVSENILYDGLRFWLIDHGEALPEGLQPRHRASGGNILLDDASAELSEFETRQALQHLSNAAGRFPSLPVHRLAETCRGTWTRDGVAILSAMDDFLRRRSGHLESLFRTALGVPQLPAQKLDL